LEFIGEQGDEIKRIGRVKIRVNCGTKGTENVSVGGEAVTIMNATLKI
jgi:predicted PhzF superfamily epimerase YddE/YHI9